MSDRFAESLDQKIAKVSDHLQRLRTVRSLLSDDPMVGLELSELLRSPEVNGRIMLPQKGEKNESQHLPKILDYLRKKKPEEWVSMKEIEEGTGIERSVLYFIIDRKHKEHFESQYLSPKRKLWRLKRS